MSFDEEPSFDRSLHVESLDKSFFTIHTHNDVDMYLTLFSMFGFYNNFHGENSESREHKEKWRQEIDPHNLYRWNQFNCRGPKISGSVDLLVGGCSQTVGWGVPEEARWGDILSQKLKMSTANIAVGGWSTQSIINGIMSYISKFGKPKIVALLLPDFFRYDLVLNSNSMSVDHTHNNLTVYRRGEVTGPVSKMPKLSKRPHVSEEILSPEFSYFASGQALRFFIEYCKESNIKLVWGSWDRALNETIKYIKFLQKRKFMGESNLMIPEVDVVDYVDTGYYHSDHIDFSDNLAKNNCHTDLKTKYEKYFNLGTDRDGHMGVHAHAHIADSFFDKLMREL